MRLRELSMREIRVFVINARTWVPCSFASMLGLGGFIRNTIINLKRCRED